METKERDEILQIDWYRAIDFLPVGYKVKDYIRTKNISEESAKLLGITEQDIYFAKKEVFMRKGEGILNICDGLIIVKYDKMTWAIAE